MGVLPCPQMCTHTLSPSLLAGALVLPHRYCNLRLAEVLTFYSFPWPRCLWQCPWACVLLQIKPPLWQQTPVFWARPAGVSPWHDWIVVWKGHPNCAHRLGDPSTSLSTLEYLLFNVFVSGRYPALKQLFLKNWSSCIINYFCRSFAKFLLCYPRSYTLLQAS